MVQAAARKARGASHGAGLASITSSPSTRHSQVNVRMERELKVSGDAALAEIALSPSEATRALWKTMAKRGEARDRLLDALGLSQASSSRENERLRRIAMVEEMAQRYQRLDAATGYAASSLPQLSEDDWERLILEDMDERECERGLSDA